MKTFLSILVATVLVVVLSGAVWYFFFRDTITRAPADAETRQELKTEFKQSLPDFPLLNLSEIVVVEDYAVANWSDQNIGGMVIFEFVDKEWKILIMDGGVLELQSLLNAGIPSETARALLQH